MSKLVDSVMGKRAEERLAVEVLLPNGTKIRFRGSNVKLLRECIEVGAELKESASVFAGAPAVENSLRGSLEYREIIERLERIEAAVKLQSERGQPQKWYDTATAAKLLGKAPYSVREWCRLSRVHAEKRASGRGRNKEWMISNEELMRIKAEGLLPGCGT